MGVLDLPPEVATSLRQELNEFVSSYTVATLRDMARAWGWPLKGTSKNDLVEQMVGYLMDAPRMRGLYEALPDMQQAVLRWVNSVDANNYRTAAAALSYVENREVSATEYAAVIETLRARGLLFVDETSHPFTPAAYIVWLPTLEPARLVFQGSFDAALSSSMSHLNAVAYRLLSHVESERPPVTRSAAPGPLSPGSSGRPFTRRPGLVRKETLVAWGFSTPAERDQARFILELLALGQILRISGSVDAARLTVDAAGQAAWDAMSALERVTWLRSWWVRGGMQESYRTASTWNELDLAIAAVEGYTLRYSAAWADIFSTSMPVDQTRLWVTGLLSRLAGDRWLDLEELLRLTYHLHPDVLPMVGYGQWQWYEGGKALNATPDAGAMPWPTWQATQGRLIEAMITGPAHWLGMVDLAYRNGKPVAFRIRQQAPADEIALPADILRFQPPDTFLLRNIWQAGALHALLRQIAEESRRDPEHITYRLSAPVFRSSLDQGLTVDKLVAAFADKNISLTPAIVTRLQEWTARAGRYRLHEQVAVLEFGDDMPPEEIQAIARLGGEWLYQAAPRCLVALDADRVPALLADLRRRGYTPQVVR